MAAFVVDTGTPTGTTNFTLNPSQDLAGLFTLSEATTVESVEGYINGGAGSTGTITIYGNGPTPSAANILFTGSFTTSEAPNPGAWQGVFGQNWNLGAGSYWVSFSSDGAHGMFAGAPNPFSAYAFTNNGTWFQFPLNIGIRISGGAGGPIVPEPTSWAMMIAGFGLVGGVMRRRVTKVSYA
jgi:PEP-CTERM motif